ncbi:Transcriptional regulator, AraC family [Labilithrix luteola]|uniref:Transcriptional regulator, AraC family n=1 Tax=Labilithrix luteola TaxID=1391654 RepID=A0A0K1PU91_9BACT|nr:AraC family transcriptional regulator [Labilithrix luteola]AKU96694.1 Transcriptional regulator, AraC family [Labilithrix luteola]
MTAVRELVRSVSVRKVDATHLALGNRWGKRLGRGPHEARVYVQLDGTAALDVGGEQISLSRGDIAFLPRSDAHVIRDQPTTRVHGFGACPGMQRTDDDAYETDGDVDGYMIVASLHHGAEAPWLDLLPAVVSLPSEKLAVAGWLRETLDLLRHARALPESSREAIATSLAHVLFTQAIERIESRQDLLRDASIASVLADVRAAPEQPWELSALAKRAGLSRTVFVERASSLLGMPLGTHIRALRLARARELLVTTNAGVKEIAARVGYANASAFARAFTRASGTSPARYRESSILHDVKT